MWGKLHEAKLSSAATKISAEVRKGAISRAGALWAWLTLAEKQDLQERRRRAGRSKQLEIQETISELEQKQAELECTINNEAQSTQPMVLRECTLPTKSLDLIEELCTDPPFHEPSHIMPLREHARFCPTPLVASYLAKLGKHFVYSIPPQASSTLGWRSRWWQGLL